MEITTERPPVRTQFLVFTLFGDYVLPRGGTIWTSSLLSLLELLGVSERAARSTLSRMSRKGWLTASKHGRRSQYSITAKGWMLLTQGEQRIFEPVFADWDGLWHMVVYSLPEKKRRSRHSLRQGLTWLGFGSLAPGTWISPHNRKVAVRNLCNDLSIQKHVEIFSATHLGFSEDRDMVKQCWDLDDIAAQYHDFIERYWPEYLECRGGEGGEVAIPADQCFVRRFWLTHDFQSFPLKDPNLPTVLLPPDWIGYEARKLFDDYRRLLEEPANRFVDDVVGNKRAGLTIDQMNKIVQRTGALGTAADEGQASRNERNHK
ncbi:MAG TPA: PaaX family transcriptional regulator C-terminal domain-containing protein [Anaerolineales bacterium]|jgi:phenylacetic acid degradation operon negative regulatory protein|nr:PaaX family transcriptional regulator C-terminal domain-containing protein [Anaerolineales bacterium]